jgi:hypothetical protein
MDTDKDTDKDTDMNTDMDTDKDTDMDMGIERRAWTAEVGVPLIANPLISGPTKLSHKLNTGK